MNDIRLQNEIKQGNKIAAQGEAVWNWSSPAGKARFNRRRQMFINFIGNKGKKILEIGCGTGLLTEKLVQTNNKIFALDISSSLLKLAKKKIKNKNVKFVLGNAYKTKFKSNFFDFIIGSSVLHHLDIDLALPEFFRLLKAGGKFMFTEPNMLNPQIALERNIPLIRKIANNSQDETAFIKWSIRKKFLGEGFNQLLVNSFDFLHPQIPNWLIKPVARFGIWLERLPLIKEIAGSLVISGKKEADLHRLKRYRKIWRRKKILRETYYQFYRQIEADLNPGKTLELGSGSGSFQRYRPDIISSDIVKAKWLDLNFDAHAIPLKANSLTNIVMIDVFHHLANPFVFLNEAYRVLKPKGKIILNEPFPSPVSLLIYRLFHPEPFKFNLDYFSGKKNQITPKSTWVANQAIAYLLFFKQIEKFKRFFGKKFTIIKRERISWLVYPLSGGFENKQLVPDGLFPFLNWLEKCLSFLKKWFAFRCYVVLQKQ